MKLLVFFVIIWFAVGYILAILANQFLPLPLTPLQFGIVGSIIGLIGLAFVTSNERSRRIFFEGPTADEEGDPLVGCLWMITLEMFALALLAGMIWMILQVIAIPIR